MDLTQDQIALRKAVRDFARKEIAPIAHEYDMKGEFPFDTGKKLGGLGRMGIQFPEQGVVPGFVCLRFLCPVV